MARPSQETGSCAPITRARKSAARGTTPRLALAVEEVKKQNGSIQLRAPAQDPQRAHTLRIHLQDLDIRAGQIHLEPDPPDAGTEHLKHREIRGLTGQPLFICSLKKSLFIDANSSSVKDGIGPVTSLMLPPVSPARRSKVPSWDILMTD